MEAVLGVALHGDDLRVGEDRDVLLDAGASSVQTPVVWGQRLGDPDRAGFPLTPRDAPTGVVEPGRV